MRRIKKLLFNACSLTAIILVASLFMPQLAHAETRSVSLTATPAVLDVGGNAASEVNVSFQLSNSADSVLPIHMTTRDSLIKNGQTPEHVRALSAKNWVQFLEPDFILGAKETKMVEMRLLLPEGTSAGGHYADVIAQTLSLESDEDFIAAQPEIVVQMLISVAGTIKEDLYISQDGPSTLFTRRSSENEVSFTVKNRGNIHNLFVPRLNLYQGDSDLGAIDLQPIIILPEEDRQVTFQLPDNMKPGIYRIQAKLSYGTPSKEATSQEVRVIVLPFNPLYLLILPIAVIAALVFRARRRIVLAIQAVKKGEIKESK